MSSKKRYWRTTGDFYGTFHAQDRQIPVERVENGVRVVAFEGATPFYLDDSEDRLYAARFQCVSAEGRAREIPPTIKERSGRGCSGPLQSAVVSRRPGALPRRCGRGKRWAPRSEWWPGGLCERAGATLSGAAYGSLTKDGSPAGKKCTCSRLLSRREGRVRRVRSAPCWLLARTRGKN